MLLSRYVVAQIILKFGCWLNIQLARRKNGSNTNTGRGGKANGVDFLLLSSRREFWFITSLYMLISNDFDSTCLNCWKLFITSHDNQILYCRTMQTVIGSLWRGSLHIWDKCVNSPTFEKVSSVLQEKWPSSNFKFKLPFVNLYIFHLDTPFLDLFLYTIFTNFVTL